VSVLTERVQKGITLQLPGQSMMFGGDNSSVASGDEDEPYNAEADNIDVKSREKGKMKSVELVSVPFKMKLTSKINFQSIL
jgi:hypothetical protein